MSAISPIVWVVLAVIVLIAILYFYNKNKTASVAQAVAIANTPPPCVPFTAAQQKAEKTAAQSKCATKLLIPFVGQVQYYSCLKQIDVNLTPIKNC